MSLTPHIDDKNRKAELKRSKKEPETFSSKHMENRPDDWSHTGLVGINDKRLTSDPRIAEAAQEKARFIKEETIRITSKLEVLMPQLEEASTMITNSVSVHKDAVEVAKEKSSKENNEAVKVAKASVESAKDSYDTQLKVIDGLQEELNSLDKE